MVKLQSKRAHRKKFGVMGSMSVILEGPKRGRKITKMPKTWLFWSPVKSQSVTPQPPNFSCGHILISIQPYYTLKRFKDHIRPTNIKFHIFLNLLSEIRAKSLHKTVALGATWVLDLDQKFLAFSNPHINI